MGQAYARGVEQLNDPRLIYTHFDFHHECRKMRWDRIQLLIDQLEPELVKQGYCYYDASDNKAPVLRKLQTSVVRTNCMDCLDRTNVVQSTLARHILNQQLREIKVIDVNEKIEEHEDFMVSFRNSECSLDLPDEVCGCLFLTLLLVWADNADAVSVTYSGTGALKTDFTRYVNCYLGTKWHMLTSLYILTKLHYTLHRTGQRTKGGAMQDLNNSITRYVKNNYLDGSRQDGFDLFLGNYVVHAPKAGKYVSPFHAEKALRVRVVSIRTWGDV